MQPDDPAAVEPARRRVAGKGICFRASSSLRSKLRASKLCVKKPDRGSCSFKDDVQSLPQLADEAQSIVIQTDNLPDLSGTQNATIYRWAVVYENQRGLTFFSTPYYSSLSLLPNDPLPFTVPSASSKRSRNPNVSLNDYPLPDGTWRWMSKAWMIDMRTDLGEVQHDGFEYNWSFREKNWRAKIGSLSMGAWVRRRRWVRLMMRPAKWTSDHLDIVASSTEDPLTTLPSTSSFLLVHPDSDIERDEPSKLWVGDPDSDWDRCRRLLKRVGSDGRKLELWRLWLDLDNLDKARDEKGKVRRQGEDYQPSGPTWKHGEHSPPLPYLKSMLQNHADAILRTFVFPESRAQFLELLMRAALLDELAAVWHLSPATVVDFWSYTGRLDKRINSQALDTDEIPDNKDRLDTT